MRDPNRIDNVIEKVRRIWKLVPDWRLGQLICNIARDGGGWNSFYFEDDALETFIDQWLRQHAETTGEPLYMQKKEVYSTFQDAYDAAVAKADGRNFEIHHEDGGKYVLIYDDEAKEQ